MAQNDMAQNDMASIRHALVSNVSRQTITKTRFADWSPWASALALAAVVALVIYGVAASFAPPSLPAKRVSGDATHSDVFLYESIAARVAAGESYYSAALAEQRAQHYPLRPVFTVRLPTLATIQARTGATAAYLLLCALTLAAWLALTLRFRAELGPGRQSLYAAGLALIGLAPNLAPVAAYWHEMWAAVLIALSLGVRTRERWVLAVGLGFAAVAVRELALPYLCLMAVLAFWQSNRREAGAWAAAIGAFFALYAWHAHTVAALVSPADLASPGWGASGGWRFVLQIMHANTILAAAGVSTTAVVVPLCLLGWAAWRSPVGLRGALLLAGYCCFFMLFGRPDNDYWGLLIAPLLPIGLVFVPGAVRDLAASVAEV